MPPVAEQPEAAAVRVEAAAAPNGPIAADPPPAPAFTPAPRDEPPQLARGATIDPGAAAVQVEASAAPNGPIATDPPPAPAFSPAPRDAPPEPARWATIDPGLLANFIYDRGVRRADGSFFVPKPLQRLFEVRRSVLNWPRCR